VLSAVLLQETALPCGLLVQGNGYRNTDQLRFRGLVQRLGLGGFPIRMR
jgi:hypothetical protein